MDIGNCAGLREVGATMGDGRTLSGAEAVGLDGNESSMTFELLEVASEVDDD